MKFKVNLRKIKGFLFRYRVSVAIVTLSFLVFAAAIIIGLRYKVNFVTKEYSIPEKKIETRVPAPLTGELVDPSIVKRTAMAVVIENSPEARPQSGYNKADIVYETLAEGGITRTVAIFHSQDAEEIGPVRSVRAYFVDWATEFKAAFVHVGGNRDGLDLLQELGTPDINQFYFGNYFWRSNNRYAPHNVYTTTQKLFDAAKNADFNLTNPPDSLSFTEDAKIELRPNNQDVSIDFSGGLFAVDYSYDRESNKYFRKVGEIQATDSKTGEIITAKNVIVQYTQITPYTNYVGEQTMRIVTTGSGKGIIFKDGLPINITWKKSSRSSATKYYNDKNEEVFLNRGQTWVEVVPISANVTYQ